MDHPEAVEGQQKTEHHRTINREDFEKERKQNFLNARTIHL